MSSRKIRNSRITSAINVGVHLPQKLPLQSHNFCPYKQKRTAMHDLQENLVKSLSSHVKRVHNKIKNHSCQICEVKFASISELNDHIKRKHERVKEFVCTSCEYAASTLCTLKKHIKAMHKHTETYHEEMKHNNKIKGHIITKGKMELPS